MTTVLVLLYASTVSSSALSYSRRSTGSNLIVGLVAEFERHLILSRTNEGGVRAEARGVKFGRKPSLTDRLARSRVSS